MSEKHFHYLVEKGAPVGEVISVDRYLVSASGLSGLYPNSLVMFADGSKGIVREIADDHVSIMHLGASELEIGTAVALQHQELVSKVGQEYVGRVVNVMGEPLDGKGPIASDGVWPVFNQAPALIGRKQLDTQLVTGVSVIDLLFPLVYGQRLAVIGEAKSGKSTLTTQMVLNQKENDVVVVYALIAKRRTDVDELLTKLEENDAMKNTIVIVSTMFDSLIASYIAPYVACAMGEHLWQEKNQDVMVVYDDLTNHAHVYREISLLAGVSPGRESFPGDMFFAHSSLLERAGRLAENDKTFTTLPIVHVPGGDITTYLPTNIMSITDGQYIMDLDLFRDGVRPAVSTGLSVSRVGGIGHNDRQKSIGQRMFKALASYNQAAEFSHFGSELAIEAKKDLETGKLLRQAFTQAPGESYSAMAQQLIFEIILSLPEGAVLDMGKMKSMANEYAAKIKDDGDDKMFESVRQELLKASLIEIKGGPEDESGGQDQAQGEQNQPAAPEQDAKQAPSEGQQGSGQEDRVPQAPEEDSKEQSDKAKEKQKPKDGQADNSEKEEKK